MSIENEQRFLIIELRKGKLSDIETHTNKFNRVINILIGALLDSDVHQIILFSNQKQVFTLTKY